MPDAATQAPPEDNCCICHQPYQNRVTLLPCKHQFDLLCISKWSNSLNDACSTCPLDRGEIESISISLDQLRVLSPTTTTKQREPGVGQHWPTQSATLQSIWHRHGSQTFTNRPLQGDLRGHLGNNAPYSSPTINRNETLVNLRDSESVIITQENSRTSQRNQQEPALVDYTVGAETGENVQSAVQLAAARPTPSFIWHLPSRRHRTGNRTDVFNGGQRPPGFSQPSPQGLERANFDAYLAARRYEDPGHVTSITSRQVYLAGLDQQELIDQEDRLAEEQIARLRVNEAE